LVHGRGARPTNNVHKGMLRYLCAGTTCLCRCYLSRLDGFSILS
jgi:hypothetical protein